MLVSALENLKIFRVVSIDDDYDLKKTYEHLGQESINEYFKIGAIDEKELQYLEDNGVFLISQLASLDEEIPEVREVSKKILKYEAKDLPGSLSILNDAISELLTSQIEIRTMNDFQKINSLDSKNTIWILDKEMNTIENAIGEEINLILKKHSAQINIFVVYTSDKNLMVLNNDWKQRNQFLLELGIETSTAELIAYQLFVIQKTENKTSLSRAFKKALIKSIRGYLVYDTVRTVQSVNQDCYTQLIDVVRNFDTLNYSRLRYNFENEGANNLIDILYNILSALEKKYLNDVLENKIDNVFAFKNIIGLGNEIRQVDLHKMTVNSLMNNNAYQSYFIDKSINFALDDIHFGDIFNIELSESYKSMLSLDGSAIGIIFSQSCDCTLRLENRNRTVNTFELGIFKLLEIDGANSRNILQTGIPIYELNKYINLDCCLERIMVPEAILDLCSFDQSGQSKILNIDELEKIKKLKKTKVWQEKNCKYLLSENILDISCDDKFREYDGFKLFMEKIISEKYKIRFDSANMKFGLQRIGRLNENIAYAALNITYMKNLRVGRNAINTLDGGEGGEGGTQSNKVLANQL